MNLIWEPVRLSTAPFRRSIVVFPSTPEILADITRRAKVPIGGNDSTLAERLCRLGVCDLQDQFSAYRSGIILKSVGDDNERARTTDNTVDVVVIQIRDLRTSVAAWAVIDDRQTVDR